MNSRCSGSLSPIIGSSYSKKWEISKSQLNCELFYFDCDNPNPHLKELLCCNFQPILSLNFHSNYRTHYFLKENFCSPLDSIFAMLPVFKKFLLIAPNSTNKKLKFAKFLHFLFDSAILSDRIPAAEKIRLIRFVLRCNSHSTTSHSIALQLLWFCMLSLLCLMVHHKHCLSDECLFDAIASDVVGKSLIYSTRGDFDPCQCHLDSLLCLVKVLYSFCKMEMWEAMENWLNHSWGEKRSCDFIIRVPLDCEHFILPFVSRCAKYLPFQPSLHTLLTLLTSRLCQRLLTTHNGDHLFSLISSMTGVVEATNSFPAECVGLLLDHFANTIDRNYDSIVGTDSCLTEFSQFVALCRRSSPEDSLTWNRLRGRFLSKFPISKFAGMTSNGVANFASLCISLKWGRQLAKFCPHITNSFGLLLLHHKVELDQISREDGYEPIDWAALLKQLWSLTGDVESWFSLVEEHLHFISLPPIQNKQLYFGNLALFRLDCLSLNQRTAIMNIFSGIIKTCVGKGLPCNTVPLCDTFVDSILRGDLADELSGDFILQLAELIVLVNPALDRLICTNTNRVICARLLSAIHSKLDISSPSSDTKLCILSISLLVLDQDFDLHNAIGKIVWKSLCDRWLNVIDLPLVFYESLITQIGVSLLESQFSNDSWVMSRDRFVSYFSPLEKALSDQQLNHFCLDLSALLVGNVSPLVYTRSSRHCLFGLIITKIVMQEESMVDLNMYLRGLAMLDIPHDAYVLRITRRVVGHYSRCKCPPLFEILGEKIGPRTARTILEVIGDEILNSRAVSLFGFLRSKDCEYNINALNATICHLMSCLCDAELRNAAIEVLEDLTDGICFEEYGDMACSIVRKIGEYIESLSPNQRDSFYGTVGTIKSNFIVDNCYYFKDQ